MTRGSEIRRKQGFYGPRVRTKRTTGNLGPRDPGPHGLTAPRVPKVGSHTWLDALQRALVLSRKGKQA